MTRRWDLVGEARAEQELAATWTPQRGVEVELSDLPDAWLSALGRIGRDLHVCQYGNTIERIDWFAEYESFSGCVLLYSRVTATGRVPSGWGVSGAVARVDDDEETAAALNAELVANEVADAGVAWPYRAGDGFMGPRLVDGVASWTDIMSSVHCLTLATSATRDTASISGHHGSRTRNGTASSHNRLRSNLAVIVPLAARFPRHLT